MIDVLLRDLRYAVRSLSQRPGFAVLTIITLALGIGATSAIFSVVNGVLLRPLPYERPDDVVMIRTRLEGNPRAELSLPEYWDLREQSRTLSRIAGYTNGSLILTGSGSAERLRAGYVTSDALSLLGVAPAIGRTFAAEEDLPGQPPVVVLSDGLWRRRFAADPSVVGRTLTLDDAPTTVLGVMPPGFQLPTHYAGEGMEMWTLLQLDPAADRSERGWHGIVGIGRLRPGTTVAAANREMGSLAAAMLAKYPEEYDAEFSANAYAAAAEVIGDIAPVILVLMGAVALLLLIACANVASLCLARAEARQREMAVRSALGAGAGRIVRQLLTESTLLAVVGGLAGLLLATWGIRALVIAAPPTLPRLDAIGLDGWVLAFTALVTLGTGLLFGLAPALQAARPDLSGTLTEGGRGGSAGGRRQRFRRGLVVSQISLALVLVAGAGLLMQSFARLRGVDPGFVPEHLLTARVELSPVRYETNAQVRAFYEQLVDRLGDVPGIASAAAVKALPMTQLELGDWSFLREGHYSLPVKPSDRSLAYWQTAGPGYFETMRIPVLQGRSIERTDRIGAPGVAVINRTLANQVWPAGDAVGQRILMGGGATDSVWRTIVGIVGDVRHRGLDAEARPEIYLPHAQFPAGTGTAMRSLRVVMRTDGDPEGATATLRSTLAAIDPDVPLAEVQTMDQALGTWAAERRLTMVLVAGFAVLALSLGAVGVYGVMTHLVVQRTREIGIRMALGAVPSEIIALVLSQGAWLAGLGITVGIVAALGATRLLAGLLFGVGPTDPVTFAAAVITLAAVAALACLFPAWRAIRTDPVDALRAD